MDLAVSVSLFERIGVSMTKINNDCNGKIINIYNGYRQNSIDKMLTFASKTDCNSIFVDSNSFRSDRFSLILVDI